MELALVRQQRLEPLGHKPAGQLLIHEIYRSIQGESTFAGLPCVFVRLTGCNLRCVWCDTAYAFYGGTKLTVEQVLARLGARDAVSFVGIDHQPELLACLDQRVNHLNAVLEVHVVVAGTVRD